MNSEMSRLANDLNLPGLSDIAFFAHQWLEGE
jgi:hypothetical protein